MTARDDYPELGRIANGFGVHILEDAEDQCAKALIEIDNLRRWKAEAITVLIRWDDVFDTLPPSFARLGEHKTELTLRYIEQLKRRLGDARIALDGFPPS